MSNPNQPNSSAAQQVAVRDSAGTSVVGWAVRPDAVVVQTGGLTTPLSAQVGEAWVEAEAVHEAMDGADQWTLLELPAGSVAVTGNPLPPVVPHVLMTGASAEGGTTADESDSLPWWCALFPRMKGCR